MVNFKDLRCKASSTVVNPVDLLLILFRFRILPAKFSTHNEREDSSTVGGAGVVWIWFSENLKSFFSEK